MGGEQITLTPSEQFAARQLAEGEYADVAALTKKLLPKLAQLAQGAVNAQFDLTYGVYRAFGNAVFAPNAPLFADARIGIGQTTAPASLWLENNRLYAEISGMPLAVDLSQTGLNLPDLSSLLSQTLAQADLSPQRIAEILMSARITEDSITIPSGVLPFEVTLGGRRDGALPQRGLFVAGKADGNKRTAAAPKAMEHAAGNTYRPKQHAVCRRRYAERQIPVPSGAA